MQVAVAERAERLSRVRAVVAIVMGSALAGTQTQRMEGGGGPLTWIVTIVLVATFLLWASGLFRDTGLRSILNDESSDVSRRRAMAIGFWNMLATGAVCYALTYVKDYGARDAIQIIATVGMTSAFISFGVGELVTRER